MTEPELETTPEAPANTGAADHDTPENIEVLWRWLTIPTYLYCTALWIRSQSDNYEVLSFIAKDHDVAIVTGLFATPVAFVSLWLSNRYACLVGVTRWPERVPRTLEKGMEGATGQRLRLALFAGIWLVILGSQIHFLQAILQGSVIDTSVTPHSVVIRGTTEMLTKWPLAASRSHDFRFGSEHGPTYFPVFETWAWLAAVTVLVASCLWCVFLGAGSRPESNAICTKRRE